MNSWDAEFRNEFRGRRILVTGATGFMGRHLCQALISLGAEVTGLSRSARLSNLPQGVVPLVVDLCQFKDIQIALAQVRADLIFHLAALTTARRDRELVIPMLETNVVGTVHLLMAASELRCQRLLIVGSSEVLGSGRAIGPSSPYAASKLMADTYGQMFYRLYGLPVICIRPFLTYGPWQKPPKLIPYSILTLLCDENPLLTSGERVCDAIYVEDVVRGLLMASVAPAGILGERIDLGTGKGITIKELIEKVAKLIDSSGYPVFGALPDRAYEEAVVADLVRTRSLLGWSPCWSLDDALLETVKWYRDHVETRGLL